MPSESSPARESSKVLDLVFFLIGLNHTLRFLFSGTRLLKLS